jgi:hypothetical protein
MPLTAQLVEGLCSCWEVLDLLVGLVTAERHQLRIHAAELAVTEADLLVVRSVAC